MWKPCVCAVLFVAVAAAQAGRAIAQDPNASSVHGTKLRASASEYPASMTLKDGRALIAAEFMGHTVPGERTTFVAEDYIVVEVAIFPAKGQRLEIRATDFQLRINEKRMEMAQPPQLVASSIKYDDVMMRPHTQVYGGMGDAGIGMGGPVPRSRFPGDPTEGRRTPRQDPTKPDATETEKQTAPEAVLYSALPEGPTTAPVSGLLYYGYKGKLKGLKGLELLVRGAGDRPEVLPIR